MYNELFLELGIFQEKIVENIKTHNLCSVYFFFENRAVFEIIRKNIAQPERPQMTM